MLVVIALGTYGGIRLKKKFTPKKITTISVNDQKFYEKMHIGAADWMKEQVQSDLKNYQAGITKEMLNQTFSEEFIKVYSLARIVVKDGQIILNINEKQKSSKGLIQTVAAIKALNSRKKLPDLDLIISMEDNIDGLPESCPGPLFIFAKLKSEDRAILLPDPKALSGYETTHKEMQKGQQIYPWDKKEPLVYWRGTTTGGSYDFNNWMSYPRSKLVLLSHEYPLCIDAKFTSVAQCDPNLPKYLKDKGLCAKYAQKIDHLKYKYLIDVDGNTSTYERCYWELLSNCVTFKHESPYIQWYYGAIKPYVHYIPVERDMGDLIQKLNWAKEHDEDCKRIAENATQFVQNQLMPEDVLIYLDEALNAYAKLQKF
ncbi:MAG: hypothetical protein JHC93_03820 [Parachlamydiales bacterium]|nr:hypothetical protein [Parachlamydiales bacterium]